MCIRDRVVKTGWECPFSSWTAYKTGRNWYFLAEQPWHNMTRAVWREACSKIKLSNQGGNALFQAELLIKQEGTGIFWLNSYGITWQELFGQKFAVKSSWQNRMGMLFFPAELLIKHKGTGLFWLSSLDITWQELFWLMFALKIGHFAIFVSCTREVGNSSNFHASSSPSSQRWGSFRPTYPTFQQHTRP